MQHRSTQTQKSMTKQITPCGCRTQGPSKITLSIIRQFARTYVPTAITTAPLILN